MPSKPITIRVLDHCPSCDSPAVFVDLAMQDQLCKDCNHLWSLRSVAAAHPTSSDPSSPLSVLAGRSLEHNPLFPPKQGA